MRDREISHGSHKCRGTQASKPTQGEGMWWKSQPGVWNIFKPKSCVNINGAGSERENPA